MYLFITGQAKGGSTVVRPLREKGGGGGGEENREVERRERKIERMLERKSAIYTIDFICCGKGIIMRDRQTE